MKLLLNHLSPRGLVGFVLAVFINLQLSSCTCTRVFTNTNTVLHGVRISRVLPCIPITSCVCIHIHRPNPHRPHFSISTIVVCVIYTTPSITRRFSPQPVSITATSHVFASTLAIAMAVELRPVDVICVDGESLSDGWMVSPTVVGGGTRMLDLPRGSYQLRKILGARLHDVRSHQEVAGQACGQ